jgi:hypothetical protein
LVVRETVDAGVAVDVLGDAVAAGKTGAVAGTDVWVCADTKAAQSVQAKARFFTRVSIRGRTESALEISNIFAEPSANEKNGKDEGEIALSSL